MSSANTHGLVTDLAGLRTTAPGTHLGYTLWREMTQDMVDRFADVTGDHQWIHVDVERATASAFGGTIAHGYLTLSFVAPVTAELLEVTDATAAINYGLDRARFPAPLPVGAQWRGGAELTEIGDVSGGVQVKVLATIEVQGAEKPACVAEYLVRFLG
jgi:acyl dehydratase